MDREKVIKGIQECNLNGGLIGNCPYKDILLMLKEQQPKKSIWIPVSERKPRSVVNRVLVYVVHEDFTSYIGFGHFEKYKGVEMWYDLENNVQFSTRGYTVTHWMPLPEPPNGEYT